LNRKRSQNTDYYRVAGRLLYNALRFRACKIRNRPLKPAALSLAVTNRCNSHCVMCNIWKNAKDNPGIKDLEMTGRKIISILGNSMFSDLVELDLTGGEPHLREDLVDIVLGAARLKKNTLPRLRSIVITSNGFLTERIISNYTAILNALKDTDIDLVSVVSIDGTGETHDLIRGTAGAFKLASKTISGIKELKQEYPNLITGIKTTIIPDNIDCLDSILDFALSNNLFHIISPAIFTESRFRNIQKREQLALKTADEQKVLDFYRRDELKTGYLYATGLKYLTTGKKQWKCTAAYNYLFIDYDGKVYPCELITETIGNVKEQDIADIWNSHEAYRRRKRTGKTERCRECHEPGAVRYSAVTGGTSYLKFLSVLGKQKYKKSLEGEGFSKYLRN
jgi:MoaA/NifB/PqqE/SkfB family radical SAM enzyme